VILSYVVAVTGGAEVERLSNSSSLALTKLDDMQQS